MNKIDIKAIQEEITSEDFVKAKKCPHLLYDENYGAALWHKCYCNFTPKDKGMPQSCNLVWRGECIQDKAEPQHGTLICELPALKPKPLAEYLTEYIDQEIQEHQQWVSVLPKEWLEQALEAYESTENVVIQIERNV